MLLRGQKRGAIVGGSKMLPEELGDAVLSLSDSFAGGSNIPCQGGHPLGTRLRRSIRSCGGKKGGGYSCPTALLAAAKKPAKGGHPIDPGCAEAMLAPAEGENEIFGKRNRLWRGRIPIREQFFCGRGHTFRRGRIKKREGKGRRKSEEKRGKNEKKGRGRRESGGKSYRGGEK